MPPTRREERYRIMPAAAARSTSALVLASTLAVTLNFSTLFSSLQPFHQTAPAAAQAAEPVPKQPPKQTSKSAAPDQKSANSAQTAAPKSQPKLGGEDNPKQCPAYKLVDGGKLKHFDYALFSLEIPIESRIKHRSVKGFHLYRVYRGSQKVRLLIYAGEYPKFPLLKGKDLTANLKKEEKKEYIEYKKDGKLVGSETLFKVPSHGHTATETRDCIVMYVHAVVPIGTPEETAWANKLVASIKPHEGFADDEDRAMEKMYRTQHAAIELKESLEKAKTSATK